MAVQCQKNAVPRGIHGILVSNPVQPDTIQYDRVRSTAGSYKYLDALTTAFGCIPRSLAASLIAFWAGEFANSYTMARMKLFTDGRMLWTRTIGSTVVGQAVDTVLVITLTFGGIYPVRTLLNIMATGYALKVGYEVIATPLTYLVVNWLKRTEHSDAFDRHESFNPFSFAEKASLDA